MKINPKIIIFSLGILIFIIGLVLFAYLGIFNRYFADDWCYNADLKKLGLIVTLRGYTYITQYASNRYSLTLFSGLLFYLDIFGVIIMTPIVIATWFLGLYWASRNFIKIASFPLRNIYLILPVSIILYYTLYLAPHLYQSIYWRSGLLPYTAPIVSSMLLLGLITQQSFINRQSYLHLTVIAVIAFLGGGFSEAGCTYLAAILGIYIMIAGYGHYKKAKWATRTLPGAIIAFIFVLAAMLILISSPTSQLRMQKYGDPADITRLPILVLKFSFHFIRLSLRDLPLPHLILAATCGTTAYLIHEPRINKMRFRELICVLSFIAVISFAIIAATLSPSAYVEQVPPAARTRIITRFAMISAIAVGSWASGFYLRQHLTAKWHNWIAMVIIIFTYIYAIRSIGLTTQKIPIYRERAVLWDERDETINQAVDQGLMEVDVRGIDGLPVGGIRDFKPKPGNWINGCAARFYGIKEIRATLP